MRRPKDMPQYVLEYLLKDLGLKRQQAYKAWVFIKEHFEYEFDLRPLAIPSRPKKHSISKTSLIMKEVSALKETEKACKPLPHALFGDPIPVKEPEDDKLDIPDREGEW